MFGVRTSTSKLNKVCHPRHIFLNTFAHKHNHSTSRSLFNQHSAFSISFPSPSSSPLFKSSSNNMNYKHNPTPARGGATTVPQQSTRSHSTNANRSSGSGSSNNSASGTSTTTTNTVSANRGRGGGGAGRGGGNRGGGNRGGSRGGGGASANSGGGHSRSGPRTTTIVQPDRPNHSESLVDIGANLTKFDFKNDLDQVLQRCVDTNVNHVIITGTDERNSMDAISMIHTHNKHLKFPRLRLYSTVGIHPHDAKKCTEQTIERLDELIAREKKSGVVCAVGETGLDFNRMFSPQAKQEWSFARHVELAIKHGLPMFLHERDAHDDFVKVLSTFDRDKLPPIVVHCFTGTREACAQYVSMGFYIGFTACVCKADRGRHLRELLADGVVPLDRIMIETDAPFMSPSFSIRRMEPCYLYHVVQTLAEIFDLPEEEVARVTTRNAKQFFNLN